MCHLRAIRVLFRNLSEIVCEIMSANPLDSNGVSNKASCSLRVGTPRRATGAVVRRMRGGRPTPGGLTAENMTASYNSTPWYLYLLVNILRSCTGIAGMSGTYRKT